MHRPLLPAPARRRPEPSGDDQFSFTDKPPDDCSEEFTAWSERIKTGEGAAGVWVRSKPPAMSAAAGDCEDKSAAAAAVNKNPIVSSSTSGVVIAAQKKPIISSSAADDARHMFDELPPSGKLTPRAQMIARYRQEMLELIQELPDTSLELSLRDIVELRGEVGGGDGEIHSGDGSGGVGEVLLNNAKVQAWMKKKKKNSARKRHDKLMMRSESFDSGLLLKMFVPANLGRRSSFRGGGSAVATAKTKVSPRPAVATEGAKGHPEAGDSSSNKAGDSSTSTSRSSSAGSGAGGGSGGISHGRRSLDGLVGGRRRTSSSEHAGGIVPPSRSNNMNGGCFHFLRRNKNRAWEI